MLRHANQRASGAYWSDKEVENLVTKRVKSGGFGQCGRANKRSDHATQTTRLTTEHTDSTQEQTELGLYARQLGGHVHTHTRQHSLIRVATMSDATTKGPRPTRKHRRNHHCCRVPNRAVETSL